MIKTLNNFHKKAKPFAIMLFLLAVIFSSGSAKALVPASGNYSKNYLYQTPCAKGDRGADLHVINGRKDLTPIACIRLTGDNIGYHTYSLPLPNAVIANNACDSSGNGFGGGASAEVYTVDGGGFGIICVTVTDASKWDKSDYSPPQAPVDTTADISCAKGASGDKCLLFTKYLIPAINFLTVGVGVVITGMMIVGGITYSTAGGDPKRVQTAKLIITNAVLSLLAYIFLWAFLQWIIPGGIL